MMRNTRHTGANRPGMSLAEVLVAMFVIAIGLLALLTFFPLGASQMAQAIKDDRTGHDSNNAAALMRLCWKDLFAGIRQNPKQWQETNPPTPYDNRFAQAQDWPDAPFEYGSPSPGSGRPQLPSGAGGPSYPVLIDPMGFLAPKYAGQPTQWWVGGDPLLGLPRRTLPSKVLANNRRDAIRFATMLDDLAFDRSGAPDLANSGWLVPRDGRYSHAWLIQRSLNSSDWRATTMTVLVHSGRSVDNPFPEVAYPGCNASGTQLTVPFAGQRPKVRKGGWIQLANSPYTSFHRVVAIDDSTPGVLQLELQTPAGAGVSGTVNMILYECLSEVFYKDTLTPTRQPTVN
jgi:prepilin-type N-terminal cleavage/methylation domain-containing protein